MGAKTADEPYVRVLRLQNRLMCLGFWEYVFPTVPPFLQPTVEGWIAQWRKEADELRQSLRTPAQ